MAIYMAALLIGLVVVGLTFRKEGLDKSYVKFCNSGSR